ncbi:BAR-domain-containing protein [Basidiobolus meristosporus CBS 931.73]|uniref:BAR-domain-containing protein n=1 Tax=Basidiobolus meristosporus CBS 931.73 TaxID=1314790 RepID=A0A1Y1YJQ4_9FUNG|nr:BAR-domain-containing protein [Basidiobolus meristosporus CBS 931.73]|eukprot:ORX98225.1 BAR-domain-containing protein [Basidiobolus meristosporus CBS 931.73]
MAAAIGKNLGKFKQWTEEKLGKANRTESSDEFIKLELETDQRKEIVEKLYMASELYLKTLEKKKKGTEDKNKISPLLGLAYSLIAQGQTLPQESPFGQAMLKFGEAQEQIANNQLNYANKLRADYVSGLEGAMNEMKELQQARKKLESRRLDYNAKLNTVQRAKKEKPELEEQMRAAELKFNESLEDTYSRMIDIRNAEELHMQQLAMFYDSELEYYQRSVEILTNIRDIFNESKSTNYYNAIRRNPSLSVRGEHSVSRSKSHRAHFSTAYEDHESSHNVRYSPPTDEFEMPRNNSDISEDSAANVNFINTSSHNKPMPPLPSRASKKKVRVLYDFEGDSKDELPIRKGDIVTVLDEIDEGWWIGELTDEYGTRAGMFPANYVESFESVAPMHTNVAHTTGTSALNQTLPYSPSSSHYPDNKISSSLPAPTETLVRGEPLGWQRPAPAPSSHHVGGSNPVLQNQSTPTAQPSPSKVTRPIAIPDRTSSLGDSQDPNDSLPCRECGCTDYVANVFKQHSCNNCFHTH